LVTAPVFGTTEAPATVRALLAFTLALLVMPVAASTSALNPASLVDFALIIAGELVVGSCLGLGLVVFLSGIQMAGELLSRIGGLTLSDIFDPASGDTIPLFSRLLGLLATAVFLLIGGHRAVLGGLLDTFRAIPPGRCVTALLGAGSDRLLQSLLDTFVTLTHQSFELGVRASIPVVTAVLLATLVLGLIGRTLPQLNVLVIGFGLNAMITFAVFSFSLGAAVLAFRDQIEPTLQLLFNAFHLPLNPL
jgi:flagellar biosynthetic protein FliR